MNEAPSSSRNEQQNLPALRCAMFLGLGGWLAAFGLGNALPSDAYRMCFDPTVKVAAERLEAYLGSAATLPFFPHACMDSYRALRSKAGVAEASDDDRKLNPLISGSEAESSRQANQESTDLPGSTPALQGRQRLGPLEGAFYLVALGLSYPVTSIALLGILAGLVGGCASRIAWAKSLEFSHEIPKSVTADPPSGDAASPVSPTRPSGTSPANYRAESVFVSTARGFAATLAYLAGVAVLAILPNRAVDPSDYSKVASLASLLAFLAGYDFGMFLQLIPMRKP